MSGEVVLICGTREVGRVDEAAIRRAIAELPDDTIVVTGGAQGVDTIAAEIAEEQGVHYAVVPALWEQLGRSAGPRRNRAMLRLGATRVIAFPGGPGTEDMVRAAEAVGVPVERREFAYRA